MDVSLTQLRTLRELRRLGTMAAVAEQLGYTHGAISQQLAGLERSVGMPLMEKAGRRVSLTDAGAILADYAETILRTVQEAQDALQSTSSEAAGPLRLGTFSTIAATLMSAAFATAAKRYPKLRISSQEVDLDDASAAVRRGEVDLAFGLDYSNAPIPREDGIDHITLTTERFGLALPIGFARERGLPVRDEATGEPEPFDLALAADWDWILPPAHSHYGRAIGVACRLAGFEPRVTHEVTDTAASLALVARGMGVAPVTGLMRELVPSLPLATLPLAQDIQRHVILARRRESSHRPSIDVMVTLLTEVVDDLVGSSTEEE